MNPVPHTASRYSDGCRCAECTYAHTLRQRVLNVRRQAELIPSSVEHGKRSTYVNWACRCDDCTAANAAYMRKWRATG